MDDLMNNRFDWMIW